MESLHRWKIQINKWRRKKSIAKSSSSSNNCRNRIKYIPDRNYSILHLICTMAKSESKWTIRMTDSHWLGQWAESELLLEEKTSGIRNYRIQKYAPNVVVTNSKVLSRSLRFQPNRININILRNIENFNEWKIYFFGKSIRRKKFPQFLKVKFFCDKNGKGFFSDENWKKKRFQIDLESVQNYFKFWKSISDRTRNNKVVKIFETERRTKEKKHQMLYCTGGA